jgi:hypothetical protein
MKNPGTLLAIGLLISAVGVFPGCASQQTETVRSTTTASAPAQAQATADTPAPPQATTTTTTDTTKTQEPDSVLGATAHAVGTVILFPFRLIGDAVGLLV